MSIYINDCNKVNDIFINVNGKKKVNSIWVNKNGVPAKVFSTGNIVNGVKIVTWADGTYDEISAMLDAHYAGNIDISDYWNVGDERIIDMSFISNSISDILSGERSFVILGFNHDNLKSGGKSAVSICLKNSCNIMPMKVTDVTGGYGNTSLYSWCNNYFPQSLPLELQSLIKSVKKKCFVNYKSSSYADTVIEFPNLNYWIPSVSEIKKTTGDKKDGELYPYFDYLSYSNFPKHIWLRTSSPDSYDQFYATSGTINSYYNIVSTYNYDTLLGTMVGFCL